MKSRAEETREASPGLKLHCGYYRQANEQDFTHAFEYLKPEAS